MCIAVLTDKNKSITLEEFNNCASSNPDGFGMIWVEEETLQTYKTLDVNSFRTKYFEICEKVPQSRKVIHFRIKSKGPIDLANCHPFKVNNDLAFVHNGTIVSKNLSSSPLYSDTYLFNEEILKKLPSDFLDNDAITSLIEDFISPSRMLFLDSKENVYLFGETSSQAHWNTDKTIWWSNNSYKTVIVSEYVNRHYYNRDYRFDKEDMYPYDYDYSVPTTTDDWICGKCKKFNLSFLSECSSCKADKFLGEIASKKDRDTYLKEKAEERKKEQKESKKSTIWRKCKKCGTYIGCNVCKICDTVNDWNDGKDKPADHPLAVIVPVKNLEKQLCTYCGKKEEIIFSTKWNGFPIKLCKMCQYVLSKESDVYFPKALFEETK